MAEENSDITVAEVRAAFPEFAAFSDAQIAFDVATAYELMAAPRRATLYCVGHLLTLREEQTGKADGGSGELKMESEGPQRAEYMTQAATNADVFFSRSAYGRLARTLEDRSHAASWSAIVA